MYSPLYIYSALLGVGSGLMNSITPSLRAVTIDFDPIEKMFVLFFFYDGEITEKLLELTSLANFDVDCEYYLNTYKVIRLDSPTPIPIRGKFAYLRKEPNLPILKKEDHSFLLETSRPMVVYKLDMQQALLGRVTAALRYVAVGVDCDNKQLEAYFTYDGLISEEDWDLANEAAIDAPISFPGYTTKVSIKRVDFPNKTWEAHSKGTLEYIGVYWRYERDW